MTKPTYTAPAVTVLGSFEEMTLGGTVGSQLDAAIPAHTPVTAIPGFTATHLS